TFVFACSNLLCTLCVAGVQQRRDQRLVTPSARFAASGLAHSRACASGLCQLRQARRCVVRRAMNTGGCFCGAIRYEVNAPLTGVTYCHCSKCRRWHGHVGAYTAVDRAAFRLTEERGLKWHAVSPTVRRGFCAECGSSVLFDEKPDPRMSICAGTLD